MKLFRTICSLALALLVMISSTSFQVGLHLCQGEVQEIAFFSKPAGCEKERELPPCHRHQKSSCCDDETIVHKADDLTATSKVITPEAPDQLYTVVPFLLISEVVPTSTVPAYPFNLYRPPLPDSDLIVAYRSLLI